jgi:hypothetical protein
LCAVHAGYLPTVGRGSDQHGPRVDDAMAGETDAMTRGYPPESRADPAREQEGPGDDEPTPDSRVHGDRGLTHEGDLTTDELNDRSELARHLRPAAFPAGRDELVAVARRQAAPDEVVGRLRSLPPGSRFHNVQDVWSALGGDTEHRS